MYSRVLQILVAGIPKDMAERVSVLPPPSYCTPHIHWRQTLTKEDIIGADVLILADPPMTCADIRAICLADAMVVFCLSAERISLLTEEELDWLEDVWLYPCSSGQMLALFRRLWRRLGEREDTWWSWTLFETLIDNIPELVWVKDLRGAHVYVNNSFCNVVGKKKSDIEGRGHYYIWDITPDEYAQGEYVCMESEEEVIRKGVVCAFEEVVKCQDGMRRFITHKIPVRGRDGSITGTLGMAHDVTDLENLSHEFKLFIESLPFGVLIINNTNKIVSCNNNFCKLFNISDNEVIGKTYINFVDKNLKKCSQTNSRRAIDAEYSIHGEKFIYKYLLSDIVDIFSNNIGKFFICRDVTHEYRAEMALREVAETDTLTGLWNRRYLQQYFTGSTKNIIQTIIFFDLNEFKQVNDTLGHQFGDYVLHSFALMLQHVFTADICVRLGGDEFIVCICQALTEAELQSRLDTLFTEMEAFNAHVLMEFPLTVSVGITRTESDASNWKELLSRADKAMYSAKRQQYGTTTNSVRWLE